MGRDRTRPALPDFRTWVRDDAACEQALLRGDPVEVDLTGYGANDYLLEFLVGSGLWGTLTGMEPDRLRKENGKPWRALNGVQVLRELAGIGQISGCGKVIRDTRLMIAAGFNAEAITRAFVSASRVPGSPHFGHGTCSHSWLDASGGTPFGR